MLIYLLKTPETRSCVDGRSANHDYALYFELRAMHEGGELISFTKIQKVRIVNKPDRLELPRTVLHADTLQLAHDEVMRIRESQSAAIANIQSRAVALFGVGAVASALAGTATSGSLRYLAVGFFFVAALAGAAAMAPKRGEAQNPASVFANASDKNALDFQRDLIRGLIREHRSYTGSIERQSAWITVGITSFALAIITLTLSSLPAFN
ncbi:hypothetical protein [Clavibacter michiganensis]|uniref:hypothetical protein n=1 Tax=Clavibacter michiganensis TaxID=28447 RepID=UPI0011775855|nr:hypothetical protein [Clavibacter michiganensis]MDO4099105.1 hypothetical protein [Clavibacter michiganensis]MDO4127546.1 hypothetical protein [Clavibacter michiganensis]NIY61658.1 hypothetical protein [Clavibacter michiganensis subsp. michiganensis]QXP02663.1 hypothetical protein KN218_14015 [Clavibacter michiganensis subsp. michiganensis]QXP05688.1 hypothetical protein KN200_14090 [Clavibacter michiganensis subsp. michiganensis]